MLGPVDGASDRRLTFTRPLVQAAVPGSEVYTYFMPHAVPAGAAPRLKVDGEAFCQALARKAATVHKRTALQALNLLPHMFALMASFGAVQTVDDIRVIRAKPQWRQHEHAMGTLDPVHPDER